MRLLGRFLMAAGLVMLPVGLWLSFQGAGMTVELTFLGAGVLAFVVGRALGGGGDAT